MSMHPERKKMIINNLKVTLIIFILMLLPIIPFLLIKPFLLSYVVILVIYELTLMVILRRRWMKSLKRIESLENNEKKSSDEKGNQEMGKSEIDSNL
jgi:hypothetical protein